MSLAVLYSRAGAGIDAPLVTVEVHLANGLPSLSIVGLPETAVKESKDRVRGALLNSQFEFPARRITINLGPADLPKEGGRFDLPIAIGILAASGQIPNNSLKRYEFVGELALSGELRAIPGVLPVAMQCREAGRALVLPQSNRTEASLVDGVELLAADDLLALCAHFSGVQRLPLVEDENLGLKPEPTYDKDLCDVKGQHQAKRALEIAAAGGHSLLMAGPPGTGKTMLASRLPSILPAMSEEEALESAAVWSISASGFSAKQWRCRPFRSPHHTASAAALVGGGSVPKPGEISLAHRGVLFLDELPEYERKVLEVMRGPLESGTVTISRAARQAEFPAQFQLIAAMNPCPCGHLGDPAGQCRCTLEQVQRYRNRISGPILDRIDMHIDVPHVPRKVWREEQHESVENSAQVRDRVEQARQRQLFRQGKSNNLLNNRDIDQVCALNDSARDLLEQVMETLGLSARAYHRILRLARTIADLAAEEGISVGHLSEAIRFRRTDQRQNEGTKPHS